MLVSIHNQSINICLVPCSCESLLQAAGPSQKNLYFYSAHELKMASPGVLRESRGFMDLSLTPLH